LTKTNKFEQDTLHLLEGAPKGFVLRALSPYALCS
jgi:hypothetical protein